MTFSEISVWVLGTLGFSVVKRKDSRQYSLGWDDVGSVYPLGSTFQAKDGVLRKFKDLVFFVDFLLRVLFFYFFVR